MLLLSLLLIDLLVVRVDLECTQYGAIFDTSSVGFLTYSSKALPGEDIFVLYNGCVISSNYIVISCFNLSDVKLLSLIIIRTSVVRIDLLPRTTSDLTK